MDDNTELYQAIDENDPTRLAQLLDSGGDVDTFFEDTVTVSSKSLLHICCGKGHSECLRVMIDHGAQLDVRDAWGQTPLMYCATIQFPENAKILLEACSELTSCQDWHGKSSLHCAVEVESIELVSLLLEFDADVNIRNHDGFTPLMSAVLGKVGKEQLDIMRTLIANGAIIDLSDYRGKRTALHLATVAGNLEAVELLIDAGTDVNLVHKDLRTPLTNAIYSGTRNGEVLENFHTIIELLISSGADLNVSLCESCNPLLASAQVMSLTLMEYLLMNGANPNVKFPSGITAALVSASMQDLRCLKCLIKFNCNLTIQGTVYKRRLNIDLFIDPFQMALMNGYVDVCILMILVGYPIVKKWNTKETQECLNIAFPSLVPLEDENSFGKKNEFFTNIYNENMETKLTWIRTKHKTPRSLKDECVFVIRAAMGVPVATNVNLLPLPRALKDYICLKHILDSL